MILWGPECDVTVLNVYTHLRMKVFIKIIGFYDEPEDATDHSSM
jgi:hypothetical protein